jgi:hypothetical protein
MNLIPFAESLFLTALFALAISPVLEAQQDAASPQRMR